MTLDSINKILCTLVFNRLQKERGSQFEVFVCMYICMYVIRRGGLPISYHLRHFTLYFIFGTDLNATMIICFTFCSEQNNLLLIFLSNTIKGTI